MPRQAHVVVHIAVVTMYRRAAVARRVAPQVRHVVQEAMATPRAALRVQVVVQALANVVPLVQHVVQVAAVGVALADRPVVAVVAVVLQVIHAVARCVSQTISPSAVLVSVYAYVATAMILVVVRPMISVVV